MEFDWPLPEGTPISQPFGSNPNNGYNPAGGHTGTDFAVPVGTDVRALADGVVKFSDWANVLPADYRPDGSGPNPYWLAPSFGGIVLVIDYGPVVSVFAHLSDSPLNAGDTVKRGQVVAKSGNTGGATSGAHLHFETLPDGWDFNNGTYGRVDPATICNGYWTGGTVNVAGGPTTLNVSSETNVRTAPFSSAGLAPGYEDGLAVGAPVIVQGYVKGQDVNGQGDNAWFKTKSGFYIWANNLGNDLTGIPYLGDMSGQAPAAPTPAPIVVPTPAPVVTPTPTPPAPVPAPYDFALDFATLVREDGVVVTVVKSPADSGNCQKGNPTAKYENAVIHQFGTPDVDTFTSTDNQFKKPGTQVSAHFSVSGRNVHQHVALADRAYHAASVGNDFVGIETDPHQDAETIATVRALLIALQRSGKAKILWLHKNVPGCSTNCGALVDLAKYDTTPVSVVVPPVVTPEPTPAPAPTPAPSDNGTGTDEASVLRKFFEWLIGLFINRQK